MTTCILRTVNSELPTVPSTPTALLAASDNIGTAPVFATGFMTVARWPR